jgi:hypothetical protein
VQKIVHTGFPKDLQIKAAGWLEQIMSTSLDEEEN